MEYIFDRTYLRDALLSVASKLPGNVVTDVNSEEGKETLMFILSLSAEELAEFKSEAEKWTEKIFQLSFCVQESQKGLAKTINICDYDWKKSKKIKFNSNTCSYMDTYHDVSFDYINVIFCEF